MLMRFKNKTNSIQQIDTIKGDGIKVLPRSPNGGFVDIDISNLYKEEFARAQKFFEITPVPAKKQENDIKWQENNFSRKIKVKRK